MQQACSFAYLKPWANSAHVSYISRFRTNRTCLWLFGSQLFFVLDFSLFFFWIGTSPPLLDSFTWPLLHAVGSASLCSRSRIFLLLEFFAVGPTFFNQNRNKLVLLTVVGIMIFGLEPWMVGAILFLALLESLITLARVREMNANGLIEMTFDWKGGGGVPYCVEC